MNLTSILQYVYIFFMKRTHNQIKKISMHALRHVELPSTSRAARQHRVCVTMHVTTSAPDPGNVSTRPCMPHAPYIPCMPHASMHQTSLVCPIHQTLYAPCTGPCMPHAPDHVCPVHPCTRPCMLHAPDPVCPMHQTLYAPCIHAPDLVCPMHQTLSAPCWPTATDGCQCTNGCQCTTSWLWH